MNQRRNLLWLGLLMIGLAAFGLGRAQPSDAAGSQTKALLLITTSQDGETAPCG